MTVTAQQQRPGTTRTLLSAARGGLVKRTVLPGGLRIVTEAVPGVRSVTVGIWVGVGSRDETTRTAGSAHYLEHLLFKGTPTRSALEISSTFDAVGGEVNAYTTKEYTCYYARVLDTDAPMAIDLLVDLVTSSQVFDDDVNSERGVILEEIAMRDDDPSDLVHEEFSQAVYGDASPMGRSILGTVQTIEALRPSAIRSFYNSHYTADRMVVAVAGNIDHATVVRMVKTAFRAADALGEPGTAPAVIGSGAARTKRAGAIRLLPKQTEQANVVLGVPGLRRDDSRRYAMGVLNAALGGGMSSRLFQEIREKRGLAYTVYSFSSAYTDTGTFGIYAGCRPRHVDDVLALAREELIKVAEHGLTAEELTRGQGQLRGGIVLGTEDTGSKMTRLGKGELVGAEFLSIDQLVGRINAVTSDDVTSLAAELLAARPTLAVIGPFEADRDFSSAVA